MHSEMGAWAGGGCREPGEHRAQPGNAFKARLGAHKYSQQSGGHKSTNLPKCFAGSLPEEALTGAAAAEPELFMSEGQQGDVGSAPTPQTSPCWVPRLLLPSPNGDFWICGVHFTLGQPGVVQTRAQIQRAET